MQDRITPVSQYMSPMPHCIEPHQTLVQAQKRMRELHCRHLPVRSSGRLVGIISDRDIALISGIKGIDVNRLQVLEAMTSDPYTVSPDVGLAEVAATMAANHYGSALVINEADEVLGIFTNTDALRALARAEGNVAG